MIRIPIVLALTLAAIPAAPQKKHAEPAPRGSNWVRTSVPPLLLAKLVEDRMHTLSKASLQFVFSINLPIGRGMRTCQSLIASPTKFRIEIPKVGGSKFPLTAVTVVTDGRMLGLKPEEGKLKLLPYTKQRTLSADMLKDWLYNGVGDLMQAVGSSADPLTGLVRAASRPGSGYEAHTETRTVSIQGKPTQYDRIVVRRKKGGSFYEIVISDHFKLPTSMSSTVQVGKKKYYSDMTGSQWAEIKQAIDPKVFNPRLLE